MAAIGLFTAVDVAIAQQPTKVAGRTIDEYAAQLGDADRVVRLRAVKSLGAFGESAGPALVTALDHDDKAVQYIAAVQLGRIGSKSLQDAEEQLQQIAQDKDSLAVRMAASFALCSGGQTEQYLPTLIEGLQYPERGMVCGAAELLGMLGGKAAGAVAPLEAAYEKNRPGAKGGDYHIGGAAMNALRKIQDE